MGHKVNPIGFRLLINKNWGSVWFDMKNYKQNLLKDLQIRNFIKETYAKSGISKVIIERTGNKICVVIKTSKPGILIGKKGSDIEKIKKDVEKMGEKDVVVKVVEVEKPNSDAEIVAQGIARQIEGRASYRRAIKKAIQSAMRYNIKGIKIASAGRLGGAEIARTEVYKEGSVPLHTLKANIDYATATAHASYGAVGIKVWIYKN
jgi:small subunit ribosomal protein S3